MALPTKTDLETMDFVFQGQPFVDVPSKPTVDLSTMDWSFHSQPFVSNNADVPLSSRRRAAFMQFF
jgi:hypothetical protein